MPTCIKSCDIYLFADDSQCSKTIQNAPDCQLLQSDLDYLCSWSSTWMLKFNAMKCKHIRFGPTITDFTYSINGIPITSTFEHKDLGVIFSSTLSFTTHLNTVLSKTYKVLGLIKRSISFRCHPLTLRALYISLVRSQVSYYCQIWRPYLVKDCIQLERLQRRSTKFILKDYVSDYQSRLFTLDLLPLSLWMEILDILLFVKLVKFPPDNFSILTYISFISSSARSSSSNKIKSNLPIPRSNTIRHFYFNRLPRISLFLL